MEPLTDLRQARFESVEGDRAGTEKRAAREWSGGRIAIPKEYQTHYREEYGTTLTDKQFEDANVDQTKFKESIASAKGLLSSKRAEVEDLYNKQTAEFDKYASKPMYDVGYYLPKATQEVEIGWANRDPNIWVPVKREGAPKAGMESTESWHRRIEEKKKEIANFRAGQAFVSELHSNEYYMNFYNDWASKNAIKVYVRDPKNPSINKDFWVTPDTAATIDAIDFGGYGDAVRNKDGSVTVHSDTYAAQVRGELDKYEISLHSALSQAYTQSLSQTLSTGRADLTRQKSLADESIASQERIISEKEAANANTLSTIRAVYANKLNKMSETIGSMQYA